MTQYEKIISEMTINEFAKIHILKSCPKVEKCMLIDNIEICLACWITYLNSEVE